MAILQLTHASILNSNAQLLVLPVNNAGVILDPVLARATKLYRQPCCIKPPIPSCAVALAHRSFNRPAAAINSAHTLPRHT